MTTVARPRVAVPRSGWFAIGTVIAALLGPAAGLPAIVLLAAAVALVGLAARGADPRIRRVVSAAALLAIALGMVAILVRLIAAGPAPLAPTLPDGSGPWTATVVGVGSPRAGAQSATLDLESGPGVVRVASTLPRYPEVAVGDVVAVGGSIRPPPADGYGDYLRRIGAAGTLQARTLSPVRAAPLGSVDTLRRLAGDALRVAMPEPEAGLAAGILIGLRERVDRDLAAAFATAGASHIVAISGWNIALVAGLVASLLRRSGSRTRLVVIAAAIVAYTIAAGASPSVLRAAVMAGVVLLARGTGRAGRAPAALGWATAILLLVEPANVSDAGLQLSVVATAGLLAWASPLTHRLATVWGGRLPGWLAESLGVSLAAQAATLPIVLWSFGRLSLVAPLVNLAVVPLVPIAMATGVVALLGGVLAMVGAPPIVATALGLPAWLSLTLIVHLVRLGASAPAAALDLGPDVAGPAAAAAAAALAGVMLIRRRRAGRPAAPSVPAPQAAARKAHRSPVLAALLIATIGSLGLAGLAIADRVDRSTVLTVLDVGQGDAILLETSRGSRMLVDGGPDPDRLLVALDERIPAWDRRLDVVVLSHPHEDHVAGLAELLARYRVGRVFEPGMHGPGPGWKAWDAALAHGRIPRATISTGGHLTLDDVHLSVLWPDRSAVPLQPPDAGTGINNVSIVFLGEVGRRRFLLAGDIEQAIDPILLERGVPRVDVLKVAHHGSATASTDAFLDAARPAVAIASAGAGNPYGHPAPGTLARLRAHGARVLRTDQDGTVQLRISDAGIDVSTSGPRSAARPDAGIAVALGPTRSPYLCGVLPPGRFTSPPPPTGAALAIARPLPVALGVPVPVARYHPADDGPRTRGGGPPAVLTGPTRLVRAARHSCRRCGGLAGTTGVDGGPSGRPPARRGGGAAARRRQAPAPGRSPPCPAAWRRLGGLAHGSRRPGACRCGPGPPGAATRRAGRRAASAGRGARGAARRLRGQTRWPAAGVDGGTVRFVAAALSGRRGRRWMDTGDHPRRRGRRRDAGAASLRRARHPTP